MNKDTVEKRDWRQDCEESSISFFHFILKSETFDEVPEDDVIRSLVRIAFLGAIWKMGWRKIKHVLPIHWESTEPPFCLSWAGMVRSGFQLPGRRGRL